MTSLLLTENFATVEEDSLLRWAEAYGVNGDLRSRYAVYDMIMADTPFSRGALNGDDVEHSSLWDMALAELKALKQQGLPQWNAVLLNYRAASRNALWGEDEEALVTLLEGKDMEAFLVALVSYYRRHGFGDFAFYPFFRWSDGDIHAITHPDLVEMDTLLGYEDHKSQICRNTEAFLQGGHGNNVLLYGERGTGKSSTVKAVGTKYCSQGLRLVELDRGDLDSLGALCRCLEGIGLHFIICIDDLSFDDFETDYKSLKAVLEGSLAKQRDNILIYATSNRRHLIKETWSERQGGEINARENADEKMSLADRFGLAIAFLNPNQEEFLSMVADLARRRGLDIPADVLRREALIWEKWQHGPSGRTAVQFVNEMEGRLMVMKEVK
ncbi:MAG: ATP-binding protein [Bacillota bacterium]|nr:ATP-binding protein [Bacillota bacterium]